MYHIIIVEWLLFKSEIGPGNLIFVTLSENTGVLTANHATNGQTNKLSLRSGRGSPCGRHQTVPRQSYPKV